MKIQNGSFAAAMNAVAGAAKDTDYDNTTSGLEADKVQSAIDTLLERIKVLENRKQSHIGMIVQSSKLDTMEKVISEYGGTTWVKIEGRFLLGDSSSHAIDSTGGSEDAIIPYHNHSIPALSGSAASAGNHSHMLTANGTLTTASGTLGYGINTYWGGTTVTTNGSGAHTHSVTTNASNTGYVGTSGNTTGANMPPYKTIYIWERTA